MERTISRVGISRVQLMVGLGLGALVLIPLAREVTANRSSAEPRQPAAAQSLPSVPTVRSNRTRTSRGDVEGKGELPPLPATFRGTTVDGDLTVDDRGRFVPDERALRLFQYFFSASGLESDDLIRARIEREIAKRLDVEARSAALSLLADFVQYRQAGRELAAEARALTPEQRVRAVYALRRETFGEEVSAVMFRRDELVRAAQMERSRIRRDPTLSESERDVRLAEVEANLPPSLQTRRARSLAALHTYAGALALRGSGASEATVAAFRARAVGVDAQRRLSSLDERERAFRSQLAQLRERVRASPRESSNQVGATFIRTHFEAIDRARALAQLEAGFPSLQ